MRQLLKIYVLNENLFGQEFPAGVLEFMGEDWKLSVGKPADHFTLLAWSEDGERVCLTKKWSMYHVSPYPDLLLPEQPDKGNPVINDIEVTEGGYYVETVPTDQPDSAVNRPEKK